MGLTSLASIDQTLAALADPYRRQVIDLLSQGPRPAGELARELGLGAPAMSRALKALRDVGLVAQTHPPHDARLRVYALQPGPMREIKQWLEATENLWSEQLMAFKVHIEAGR
jgi:DNA-binding transcriptional ArsR family regulator